MLLFTITVLPLWEHYDAVAYDTCASIAPILKVPAEHLIAVNAWRYTVAVLGIIEFGGDTHLD